MAIGVFDSGVGGLTVHRRLVDRFPQADFLYVVYDVGGSSSSGEKMIRHTGREYGLVLSGVLEVTVGFDTYELGPGDSISFDSATPHRLQNKGTEPVHGVWFVVGRGADLRLAFDQGETAGADGA